MSRVRPIPPGVYRGPGLQHVEHGLLGPDSPHVAFGEAPGVTVFRLVG